MTRRRLRKLLSRVGGYSGIGTFCFFLECIRNYRLMNFQVCSDVENLSLGST